MSFSLEIGLHTDIDTLPTIKDVYITFLPGEDYVKTAKKETRPKHLHTCIHADISLILKFF